MGVEIKVKSHFGVPDEYAGKEEALWYFLADSAEGVFEVFSAEYKFLLDLKNQPKVLKFEGSKDKPVVMLGREGRLPSGINVFVGAELDPEEIEAFPRLRLNLPGSIVLSIRGEVAKLSIPDGRGGELVYSTKPLGANGENSVSEEMFGELIRYVTGDGGFLREVQRAELSGKVFPKPELVAKLGVKIRIKLGEKFISRS